MPGHWEGDLMIGRQVGFYVGTLWEWQSRQMKLLELPKGRTARQFRRDLSDASKCFSTRCVVRSPGVSPSRWRTRIAKANRPVDSNPA